MFNQDVIAAVKAAKFCSVVVYPAVRGGGERVLLEMAGDIAVFGAQIASAGQGTGW